MRYRVRLFTGQLACCLVVLWMMLLCVATHAVASEALPPSNHIRINLGATPWKYIKDNDDANAMQPMTTGGRGQSTRLGILTRFVVVHGNEEYGYGSIYLRLKGIVPPSSDNAGRGGK